jgi:hypothetical protein
MAALGEPIKPFADKGEQAVAAGGRGALVNDGLVDEVAVEEDMRDRGAAFDEETGDAAPGELVQGLLDGG